MSHSVQTLFSKFLVVGSVCFLSSFSTGCQQSSEPEEHVSLQQTEVKVQPNDPQNQSQRFELKLEPGDRFPMIKTITQRLTDSSNAQTQESKSHLKLWLTMSVEKVQEDGMKLMHVRYHRVAYSQDVGGKKIEYHSDQGANPNLPMDVMVYAGMVNNGFSFWLGADNKIQHTVNFTEFLKNCIRNVPAAHQQSLLTALLQTAGDNGIANFVDDSIGLLPYSTSNKDVLVHVNETWSRNQHIKGGLPMQLQTNYTLNHLEGGTAEIDIQGKITPTLTQSNNVKNGEIQLVSGKVLGRCSIARKTGLPLRSEVQRILTLAVAGPQGKPVMKNKTITTTIETFANQGSTQTVELAGPEANTVVDSVKQVSHQPQNPPQSSVSQPDRTQQ